MMSLKGKRAPSTESNRLSMNIDYQARITALQGIAGVDAVALVPGANMHYFTGLHYHLSERPIIALVTAEGLSFIVPRLEVPSLTARPDLEARPFMWGDTEGYHGAFREALETLGLQNARIGIDGMTMRATEMLHLQAAAPALRLSPIERELIRIRAYKRPDEIAAMREAVKIAEAALAKLLTQIHVGMTERQIAAQLVQLMLDGGAERPAFDTLVQTGTNSANPHGTTTDRPLQAGEFLLIDYGCTVSGYPSDITRTFCFGEPTLEMQRIYDTVLRANEAARAVARPGVAMGEVDKAARTVIEEAGYGQYFTHRTGHGIGLDVHEPIPQIASGVTDVLEAGMAFTIEPGIYLPHLGGVRIEENVVVTDAGLDVLTTFERKLRV
jgi:Xaa-Pro dipeptidase